MNFDGMSDAEKRVAVAQDVIAQVKLERIVPTRGEYSDRHNAALGRPCHVCALGAMTRSAFGKSFEMDTYVELRNIFGFDVGLIEDAFELWDGGEFAAKVGIPTEAVGDGTRAKYSEPDGASRMMLAIMQNIIDNHGQFAP